MPKHGTDKASKILSRGFCSAWSMPGRDDATRLNSWKTQKSKVTRTWQFANSPHCYGNSRAMWDHSVNCHMPPGRFGDIFCHYHTKAGTQFNDHWGMQDWADLVGWLHTEMMVTHPSGNRARRRVTSFMCWMPLTTTPYHQQITTAPAYIAQTLFTAVALWWSFPYRCETCPATQSTMHK